MGKVSKARKEECITRLKELIKPGDTVYCTLKHVSRSGMYRVIDLHIMKDNEPWRISTLAADLLEGYDGRWEGCKAHGCGMDMGFHLVYNLSSILFPDGFGCIGNEEGKCCPSNDHSNGDRDYTPHMEEKDRIGADGKLCTCHKTHWHTSGGYALRRSWM